MFLFCRFVAGLPLLPFFYFQGFPVLFYLRGGVGLHISEDMGVPVDELGGKAIEHIVNGKG